MYIHNNDNATFFDIYSRQYDKKLVKSYFTNNLVWFIKQIPNLDGNIKVLDVGCGTGILCNYLSSTYANIHVHGVDISEAMISKSQNECYGKHNVCFAVGDAHNLDAKDDEYDYVFNTISFHHYADPQKVLSEFYRVLKPGGKLLLMDSITNPLPISFMPLIWDLTERRKCYTRHLASSEFHELFCNSSFKRVEYKYYSRLFPARHILCIAQK